MGNKAKPMCQCAKRIEDFLFFIFLFYYKARLGWGPKQQIDPRVIPISQLDSRGWLPTRRQQMRSPR